MSDTNIGSRNHRRHTNSQQIELARELWAAIECDPDDCAPPWAGADPVVRRYYTDRAELLHRRLEDLGWEPPPALRRRHYPTPADIPIGGRFRPIGDPRRVLERDSAETAREVRADGSGLRIGLARLARFARRGFMEAR